MNTPVKVALIIAAAIIIVAGLVMYYSPYQSCVRAMTSGVAPGSLYADPAVVAGHCSRS